MAPARALDRRYMVLAPEWSWYHAYATACVYVFACLGTSAHTCRWCPVLWSHESHAAHVEAGADYATLLLHARKARCRWCPVLW